MLLTIANVFIDVWLRYAFNSSSIALQELEWHLFSTLFLLGISYALLTDSHVRVDVFYAQFSRKTQAWINVIGFAIFIVPINLMIAYYGIDFAKAAFLIHETSADPGGLSYRFIIKSMIPISAILVIFSGAVAAQNYLQILRR